MLQLFYNLRYSCVILWVHLVHMFVFYIWLYRYLSLDSYVYSYGYFKCTKNWISNWYVALGGLPLWLSDKESAWNAGDTEMQVWSLGREDPLEEEKATHSVYFPAESHGQRSLEGCSPWGHKELGTTEATEHVCRPWSRVRISKLIHCCHHLIVIK